MIGRIIHSFVHKHNVQNSKQTMQCIELD